MRIPVKSNANPDANRIGTIGIRFRRMLIRFGPQYATVVRGTHIDIACGVA